MNSSMRIRVGFMPLADAAPLVVAREMGFARDEGVEIVLSRETSWATVRDRLSVGHLDASHALAPLPLATKLGLGPLHVPMSVPIALGCGGNTVTVADWLFSAMADKGASADFDCKRALSALASIVTARRARGLAKFVFAVVHQHSAHRYQLAYWFASAGIIPGRDVSLVVLPPSLMPEALQAGNIDGFCAGEPWGSVAVSAGGASIVTTNSHIWRSSPEKVLSTREDWVEEDPDRADALVRAIWRASVWCDDAANTAELAELLARPEYVDAHTKHLLPGLSRKLPAPDGRLLDVPGLFNFARAASGFPWLSHALWFLSQMARWDEIQLAADTIKKGCRTFRPDIYRRALAPLGVDMPSANSKVEGALPTETPVGSSTGKLSLHADGFFDGARFDPDRIDSYVAELKALDSQVRKA